MNLILSFLVLLTIYTGAICKNKRENQPVQEDAQFWENIGRQAIKSSLQQRTNPGIAKNVILFVGDGMGMSTITAGRIYKGQLQGKTGEEGYLTFEKFPHVGLSKTYNVNKQVPDSAATATALFSGIKGNFYSVGLDSHARFNICNPEIEKKSKVSTILEWAIAANKTTGLVTTTRITHATPSAAYAHSSNRDWECDSAIPINERQKGCKDLARQLVEDKPGKDINVILGGGAQQLRHSLNQTVKGSCKRNDSKDLVYDWMQIQKRLGRAYKFVTNKEELMNADNDSYLLGLFANSHMPYDKDRDMGPTGHPSLSDMVSKAIDVLSRNENGFTLIVEGGRIDHAHHDNLAEIALEEVVAFDLAIETALSKVRIEETLIIVTADHSHSFSINGYPKRGNPIQGLGDNTPEGYAYETLSYINGPGYNFHRVMSKNMSLKANETGKTVNTWKNLNGTAARKRKDPHHAGYWRDAETHGGEDVPIYAVGPMAHLIHGVHEQTHVAYTIAYSSCMGPYAKKCREGPENNAVVVAINAGYNFRNLEYNWIVIVGMAIIVKFLF